MTGMLIRLSGLVHIRNGNKTRCGLATVGGDNKVKGGQLCQQCQRKDKQ